MRTITWTCAIGPDWQWQSGSAEHPGFRAKGDDVRTGTITLPPNPDYWYDCMNLVIPGGPAGNAFIRYFNEDGVDKVQAISVAQGQWEDAGQVDKYGSQTSGSGGIKLLAQLV